MTTKTTVKKNTGCGDGSGRWLFEEFQLSDGRWAKFVVNYVPAWAMAVDPEYPSRWWFQANWPEVVWTQSELFDEQGNSFVVTGDLSVFITEVLGAFREQLDEVEVYEREWR